MRLADLDHLARRQHGVVERSQTALTSSAWQRATSNGTLIPLHPRVARLPGTADTAEQRIIAAVLAAGSGALASHRSAAALWGMERRPDEPVDIILPGTTRHVDLAGVAAHRPSDQGDLRPRRRRGIPCTSILRTLCDLGAVDAPSVHDAVGVALAARLTTLDVLDAALRRHSRPGRSGVRALRAAIDAWAIDHRPADSVLEVAFASLIDRYRLPPATFHERIEGWEVDFRFVDTAVVVECDGWATHGLVRDQFERDRRKDDDLRAAGWIPLRFTYRSIVTDGAATARRIRRSLDRWAHLHPPDQRAA